MKKSVQFTSPEITDTIYRPKTSREDVNSLYFQEAELWDWEHDEQTTLRDRFEVVVTEIIDDTTAPSSESNNNNNNNNETSTTTTSSSSSKYTTCVGIPIISFYDSYSYSFQEDDD